MRERLCASEFRYPKRPEEGIWILVMVCQLTNMGVVSWPPVLSARVHITSKLSIQPQYWFLYGSKEHPFLRAASKFTKLNSFLGMPKPSTNWGKKKKKRLSHQPRQTVRRNTTQYLLRIKNSYSSETLEHSVLNMSIKFILSGLREPCWRVNRKFKSKRGWGTPRKQGLLHQQEQDTGKVRDWGSKHSACTLTP